MTLEEFKKYIDEWHSEIYNDNYDEWHSEICNDNYDDYGEPIDPEALNNEITLAEVGILENIIFKLK